MPQILYLSEAEHARVTAAISDAEHGTSGEIVTILADRSDGYTDVALAWAALAAFLELTAFVLWPGMHLDAYAPLRGDWVQDWTPRAIFTLAALAPAAIFCIVLLLQLWQPLKFALIPPPVKTNRVHDRAIRAFRIGAERRTQGRTGILIYLSMREHRAEIVADEAIATLVEPDVWGDAMEAILAHLKDRRTADGLIAGVERVGAILTEYFPAGAGNPNELPDRLIEV